MNTRQRKSATTKFVEIFGIVLLIILYFLSEEFILLLLLLGLISMLLIERKFDLTLQQQYKLGLIVVGVVGIVFGIYVDMFWFMLMTTIGVVAFLWSILKFTKVL